MPRVSVIIPTFNCARFLDRAIASALEQTYTDYEIIVADDGSTDDTRDIVARIGNKTRYFFQPNGGLSSARNLGLSKANGEFIAYLDADDMWYPHKLESQVAFLDAHGECGLVHSDVTVIDESDQIIHRRFNQETGRTVPNGHCLMDLLRRCHINATTVLERRRNIELIGGFDERLKSLEDYLHWIRVAMEGLAVGYINEPLAMYRWRAASLSSNRRGMAEARATMLEILLERSDLPLRCGQEAAEIVQEQLFNVQRDLAYLDRINGRMNAARRRLLGLVKGSPLRTGPFVDLVKCYIPQRWRRGSEHESERRP
jgi:glycosyltransferase involved in cell wall biosynthesis